MSTSQRQWRRCGACFRYKDSLTEFPLPAPAAKDLDHCNLCLAAAEATRQHCCDKSHPTKNKDETSLDKQQDDQKEDECSPTGTGKKQSADIDTANNNDNGNGNNNDEKKNGKKKYHHNESLLFFNYCSQCQQRKQNEDFFKTQRGKADSKCKQCMAPKRRCRQCNQVKNSVADFSKSQRRPGGKCKSCVMECNVKQSGEIGTTESAVQQRDIKIDNGKNKTPPELPQQQQHQHQHQQPKEDTSAAVIATLLGCTSCREKKPPSDFPDEYRTQRRGRHCYQCQFSFRQCCACNQDRRRPDFLPSQWNTDRPYCRRCIEDQYAVHPLKNAPTICCSICQQEAPRSLFSHYEIITTHRCRWCLDGNRRCSTCNLTKYRKDYSKGQWKLAEEASCCKQCMEKALQGGSSNCAAASAAVRAAVPAHNLEHQNHEAGHVKERGDKKAEGHQDSTLPEVQAKDGTAKSGDCKIYCPGGVGGTHRGLTIADPHTEVFENAIDNRDKGDKQDKRIKRAKKMETGQGLQDKTVPPNGLGTSTGHTSMDTSQDKNPRNKRGHSGNHSMEGPKTKKGREDTCIAITTTSVGAKSLGDMTQEMKMGTDWLEFSMEEKWGNVDDPRNDSPAPTTVTDNVTMEQWDLPLPYDEDFDPDFNPMDLTSWSDLMDDENPNDDTHGPHKDDDGKNWHWEENSLSKEEIDTFQSRFRDILRRTDDLSPEEVFAVRIFNTHFLDKAEL